MDRGAWGAAVHGVSESNQDLWLSGSCLGCSLAASKHGLEGTWSSVVITPGPESSGLTVVAYRLSCSMSCGIFPDPRSNPPLLHWQANSLSVRHQGSAFRSFKTERFYIKMQNLSLS